MQNPLKELNENILPKAFELLEEGKSISVVKNCFIDQIDSRFEKTFVYRLNFYVKQAFRQKYNVLKNILCALLILVLGYETYDRFLDFITNAASYSTFAIVLNVLLVFFIINLIVKLYQWDGRYVRSSILFMLFFTVGDLFVLSSGNFNAFFMIMFGLKLIIMVLAIYLYRSIFPTHGLAGPPKETKIENDILDDFR